MKKYRNLEEYLASNSLTTKPLVESHLEGKTLVVIANSNNHPYGPKGTKFKAVFDMSTVSYNTTHVCIRFATFTNGLFTKDFNIVLNDTVESLNEEMKEINEQIISKQASLQKIEEKLTFMREHNLTEFDEDLMQIYNILGTISSKKVSLMDKAVEIKKLLGK